MLEQKVISECLTRSTTSFIFNKSYWNHNIFIYVFSYTSEFQYFVLKYNHTILNFFDILFGSYEKHRSIQCVFKNCYLTNIYIYIYFVQILRYF